MGYIRKLFIKFSYLLIFMILVIFVLYHITGSKINYHGLLFKWVDTPSDPTPLKCEIIHIGIVWIGYQSNFFLYTMLKSLYLYRSNPLHFHIIVDDVSERNLENMFERWAVPQVTWTFYNVNNISPYSSLSSDNLKLMFPEIIPTTVTTKIILLNTYLTFTKDVHELWKLFDQFKEEQAMGLVENQRNEYFDRFDSENAIVGRGFNSDVMLLNTKLLHTQAWEELLSTAVNEILSSFNDAEPTDQNIINAIAAGNFELVYIIPCYGNIQRYDENLNCKDKNQIKVVNWNTSTNVLNKTNKEDYFGNLNSESIESNGTNARNQLQECGDFNENIGDNQSDNTVTWPPNWNCADFDAAYSYRWRTLLYFREFQHNPSEDDVTLVSHFTYDRLPVLEKLAERWEGPMSLALFITDAELFKFMNYVENSKMLQNRSNIAYHAIFQETYHHPINLCRNVAMRNVVTPYVFLNDIDFVPMQGMYESLKLYVSSIEGMERKALVVPAFDTNPKYKEKIPETRQEMITGMKKNRVYQTMKRNFKGGHSVTDHNRWRTAQTPYKVEWKFKYEPYVVVQRNVSDYDERFVGYSWDKVSFFTKLKAQDYEFWVLPNSFIVHKRHDPAPEKRIFIKSKQYQSCLRNLMMLVVNELSEEYGVEIPVK